MKCHKCGAGLVEWKTSGKDPYHYTSSGLDNVYLVNIAIRRCKRCRTEHAVIPRMAELHRMLAGALLDEPERLRGSELRFLRKHAGLSASDFSAQLQIEPETLSRFENARQDIGVSTEKLARAILKAEIQTAAQNKLQAFLLSKQRLLAHKGHQQSRFSFTTGGWRKQAA